MPICSTPRVAKLMALSLLIFVPSRMVARELDLFEDVTAAAGIEVNHGVGHPTTGQAWGDVDRDGCPDLFLTSDRSANRLYRSQCDGTFEVLEADDVLQMAASRDKGAVFADYDNDGWLDLYVSCDGPNHLFRNLAGAGWEDVTATAAVGDARTTSMAAWADFNGDGQLDLLVANYDEEDTLAARDTLYEAQGTGTFVDVTAATLDEVRTLGPAFATRWLDWDNDGDQDLYVVNDKLFGNVLWQNNGPGCGGWCFSNVSLATGAHRPVDGMGIAAGDYDNDGDLDLYFSSSLEQVLLRSEVAQGTAGFAEVSEEAGVTPELIGWGAQFIDVDNDGWQDLYLAIMSWTLGEGNRLFLNDHNGAFSDASSLSGADALGWGLGVAVSDFDRDGWVDLVAGGLSEPYLLFRNRGFLGAGNGWLRVRLSGGTEINRDAVGARVWVHRTDGLVLLRDVRTGSSLGAGSDMAMHFGLGMAGVSRVVVEWPHGESSTFLGLAENAEHSFGDPEVILSNGFESGVVE